MAGRRDGAAGLGKHLGGDPQRPASGYLRRLLAEMVFWREARAVDWSGRPAPRGRPAGRSLPRLLRYFRPFSPHIVGIFVLIFLVSSLGTLQPLLLRQVVNVALPKGNLALLLHLVLPLLAVGVAMWLLHYVNTFLYTLATNGVIRTLRRDLYAHLLRVPPAFFEREGTETVMARVVNDVGIVGGNFAIFTGLSGVFRTMVSSLSAVVTLATTVAAMVLLNWHFALLLFAVLPPFLVLSRLFARLYYAITRRQYEVLGDVNDRLGRIVRPQQARQTRLNGSRATEQAAYRASNQRLSDAGILLRGSDRAYNALYNLLPTVTTVLLWWFGGRAIMAHVLSLGTLLAFIAYVTKVDGPVTNLAGVYTAMNSLLALADRVFSYMDEPEVAASGGDAAPGANLTLRHGGVDVVLSGRRVHALVGDGPRLARGIYEALTGAGGPDADESGAEAPDVLWDGRRPETFSLADRRRRVIWVGGDAPVLPGTVRENLALARPGAPDAVLGAAGEAAGLADLTDDPQWLDVRFGDGADEVAPGAVERFVLALARAVLANPDIVVADQTSVSDPRVPDLAAVRSHLAGCTVLWRTSQAADAAAADQLVVLPAGRAGVAGPPAALAAGRPQIGRWLQAASRSRPSTAPKRVAVAAFSQVAAPGAGRQGRPAAARKGFSLREWIGGLGLDAPDPDAGRTRQAFLRLLRFFVPYLPLIVLNLCASYGGAWIGAHVPLFTRAMVDVAIPKDHPAMLARLALLMLGVAAAVHVVNAINITSLEVFNNRTIRDVRNHVYDRVAAAPVTDRPGGAGRVMSIAMNDVNSIYTGIVNLQVAPWLFINMLPSISFMFGLDARLGSVVFLTIPPFLVLLHYLTENAYRIHRRMYVRVGAMNQRLESTCTGDGIALLQLHGATGGALSAFEEANRDLANLDLAIAMNDGLFGLGFNLKVQMVNALLYYFGGLAIIHGSLSLGTLLAVEAYSSRLEGFGSLYIIYMGTRTVVSNLDRVFGLLDRLAPPPAPAGPPPSPERPVLEVEAADVGPVGLGRPDSALTFSVRAGERVALVGDAATARRLLDAVAGLQPTRVGDIRILGRPVQAWCEAEGGSALPLGLLEEPATGGRWTVPPPGETALILARTPETAAAVDRVVVLERGGVAAAGSPAVLAATHARFRGWVAAVQAEAAERRVLHDMLAGLAAG